MRSFEEHSSRRAFALLTACAVGPITSVPLHADAAYKEQDGWKPSEPNDALDRGPWWQIFNDEVLNGLEAQSISPTKT